MSHPLPTERFERVGTDRREVHRYGEILCRRFLRFFESGEAYRTVTSFGRGAGWADRHDGFSYLWFEEYRLSAAPLYLASK
jgi:hypothetical protein